MKNPIKFASAAAALMLAACNPATETAPAEPPLTGTTLGGPFELISSTGETVHWADFEGKYRIVYFGFAYCPDICPTDVSRAVSGLGRFAENNAQAATKVQPIFISIDPERDTPEVVGEFISNYSDDLIGLTGTEEQIKAAAEAFGVYYSKDENAPGGFQHTRITYLFGPEGEPLATLPTDEGAEAVAAELAKWVR